MQKNYFQLDKVHSITLTYETESNYKWFAEVAACPKTFLGIQYGMTKAIPAGWSDYEGGKWPKPTSCFDGYKWYRIDEVNKKIYIKAHVEIRFSYKETICSHNFDSNEAAQKWVDELIAASDKKFTVIINK
jgi:hypothetical protein